MEGRNQRRQQEKSLSKGERKTSYNIPNPSLLTQSENKG